MAYPHRIIPPLRPKDIARFWAKVEVRKSEECWLWKAAKNFDGYGAFGIGKGRAFRSHRVAWQIANKRPIPAGLCVLHRCDNPACCNPSPRHLFLGTLADNNHDMAQKGRGARGDKNGVHKHPECRPCGDRHGSRTHPECVPRGERHWCAKLTDEKTRDIRRHAAEGTSQRALARENNVSEATISRMVHRTTWNHI